MSRPDRRRAGGISAMVPRRGRLLGRGLTTFAAAGLLLAACQPAEETGAPSPGADPTSSPTELIFVDRFDLYSYDLEREERRRIASLPSADVAVSPAGERFAVVEETSPAGSTAEGFRKPVLRTGPLEPGAATAPLGPGRSPVWSPDSTTVAAVATAPGEAGERVVAYPVEEGGDPESVLGAAPGWTILGWTGDRVVAIALGEQPSVVVGPSRSPPEEARTLPLAPADVWGASPAELLLLVVRGGKAFLARPGAAKRTPVPMKDALLGAGAWSPDGARIAVTLLDVRSQTAVKTRIGVIDVAGGGVRRVPGSRGAQGGVVWSADSRSFAYVRTSPTRGARLEAVLCSADLECDPLFDWSQGVRLLALR